MYWVEMNIGATLYMRMALAQKAALLISIGKRPVIFLFGKV